MIITNAVEGWAAMGVRRWSVDYLKSKAGARLVPVETCAEVGRGVGPGLGRGLGQDGRAASVIDPLRHTSRWTGLKDISPLRGNGK